MSERRHLLHALEIYFYRGNLKDWKRKHLGRLIDGSVYNYKRDLVIIS